MMQPPSEVKANDIER